MMMHTHMCVALLVASIMMAESDTSLGTVNNFKKIARPRDCQDLWDAGIRNPGAYKIFPNGAYVIQVHCSHTAVGTGTVIQRRSRGDESFYRNWQDYKNGFGNIRSDHWVGLEAIHHLTYTGQMKLEITVQDWLYNTRSNTYDYMRIGDETQGYQLIIGHAFGQLIDDMNFSNNSRFATWDHPDHNSCAVHQKAGWWYSYCAYALLNGVYYHGGKYAPSGGFYDGIYWKDWYGYDYSLKSVNMTLKKIFR